MTAPSASNTIHATVSGPIVMIGFGSIGRGTLPLIDRHLDFDRTRAVVVEPDDRDRAIVEEYGLENFAHGTARRIGIGQSDVASEVRREYDSGHDYQLQDAGRFS